MGFLAGRKLPVPRANRYLGSIRGNPSSANDSVRSATEAATETVSGIYNDFELKRCVTETSILLSARIVVQFSLLWDHGAASSTG